MDQHLDYLIIGAGPAGLQMGYFLSRNRRRFLILERGKTPGGFFATFPRHGLLISINKVHTGKQDPDLNMRWDWNSLLSDDPALRFTRYSSEYFPKPSDLRRYLVDFANRFQLPIRYGTNVRSIHREGRAFVVTDTRGATFTAPRLIVASGVSRDYLPPIPGIELCQTYRNQSIDAEKYRDQRVLIIGKGNSGFETANHLVGSAAVIHLVSPHSVRMAWASHFVGSLRAVNNDFLDTYQLKSQNAVIDASVDWIEREGDGYRVRMSYSHAKGQVTVRRYDRVIACTGFQFDSSIFDDTCQPELTINGRFPAQTTAWESTNVPDLYFAGTLMQVGDYKKTTSGFIHGFRYNIQALGWILEERYGGGEWPAQGLAPTAEAVAAKIIARVNSASGIFQQPGFLCDVLVVDARQREARLYTDVRRDHVPNSALATEDHYYVTTLEYGGHEEEPFNVERDPAPEMGMGAFYLHPIIRRYERDRLVAEHHINDDLENDWSTPEYVEPAQAFIRAQMTPLRVPA